MIQIELTKDAERARQVTDHLVAYNVASGVRAFSSTAPENEVEPLHAFATNGGGEIVAGLVARTINRWGWMEVDILWVSEAARGQGLGSRLLAEAEREARARGCRFAKLYTSRFQAPGFYPKQGYTLYGKLEDFPPGETTYFYRKELSEPAT